MKLIYRLYFISSILLIMFIHNAQAGTVEILAVEFHKTGMDTWSVRVTLKHDDMGWEHYADNWQIVNENGKILKVKEVIEDDYLKRVPLKRELLNRALKEIIEDLKVTKVENYHFLTDKIIENSCINCNECVEFCPSDALFKDTGESTILFKLSSCVNCNICNDICKYKSIKNIKEVDLVDFVLNRAKVLIAHDIKTCKECRMPFSYKGGDLICSRCLEFKDDFRDIFKLASEV